jgi:hypothetical protein
MSSQISLVIASLFKSQGLNQARTAIMGAQRDFGTLASSIGQAAGAFGAFQAITSSRQFVEESVNAAQRFERNILALKQVFEGAAPAIRNFAKEVENYGLSQSQAAQASVFLGSVLKQYGFSVAESSNQTQRLVKLSQDLATTYGYDVSEALLAVTALFRGEYDPIEKFGVAMKQAEVTAHMTAKGLGELTLEQESNQMAISRLELLYERTGDSLGAFERATNTLYGAQQLLNAEIGNLQIAFGEDLQKPLGAVIAGIAELADKHGPELVEIAGALGDAIEGLTPTFLKVGETLLNLVALVQPVIELLSGLANLLTLVLNPALDILNGILSGLVQFFDTWSAIIESASVSTRQFTQALGPLIDFLQGSVFSRLEAALGMLGNVFSFLNDQMVKSEQRARAFTGDFESFDNGAKAASVALRAAGIEARELAKGVDVADEAVVYFKSELESLGFVTEDSEKKLVGLAGIFADIDEAARKSQARQALDDIGFSAGQIETILTRPDWATIFGQISRLARLAAYDIASVGLTLQGAIGLFNAQNALQELLRGITSGGSRGTKTVAKDFVAEFIEGIADEVNKQTARGALQKLGIASEGLLNEIFGTEGWEEIYKRILQGGTKYLEQLQRQFGKTAEGLREINEQLAAEEKQREEDNKRELEALEDLRRKQEEYNQMLEQRVEAMREFRAEIQSISLFDVLDQNERRIGRFEASVSGYFDNIGQSLESAFDSELIHEDAYNELKAYAAAERAVFTSIQRQRDELAERINLSEALISEYKNAFTASANLVTMLGRIENKTKSVTVTEMTEGMVTLNSSLKEFKVTLTRSFEEAEAETVDKTTKLISDFRNIADKARTFAQNLRTLRDMGLDPMLFNQLVEAGVEAGGETAQALVDGGSDTIFEINDLFNEINTLGADLGEEVATTLYGAGVDMSNGLIAGLKSMADELQQTALNMAKTFADAFMAAIDAAIADALAKLKALQDEANKFQMGGFMGQNMSQVVTGTSPIGGEYTVGFMPIPSAPVAPSQPTFGNSPSFGSVNIFTDSRYGGYQAATAFTAQQSRLATNNAGISSFMKI